MMIAFSFVVIWSNGLKVKHYIRLQQQGSHVRGSTTITGVASNRWVGGSAIRRVRATHRYRVEINGRIIEVAKEVVLERESQVEPGSVEEVEMIVLPGFPKSGMEREKLQKLLESPVTSTKIFQWNGLACAIASVVSGDWQFAVPKGVPKT